MNMRSIQDDNSQRGAQCRVGYYHLVSNKREGNNCSVKNNHENSLNLADSVIFSFPPDAYSYHICEAWCNAPYTMGAKPIKTLALRYPMIQFFKILDSH